VAGCCPDDRSLGVALKHLMALDFSTFSTIQTKAPYKRSSFFNNEKEYDGMHIT